MHGYRALAKKQKSAHEIERDAFYYDVIEGLKKEKKTLHPKYFYDRQGSEYFDQICELEEYYPYKTELAMLPKVANDLATILDDRYALIEFGAGSLLKVRPLLESVAGIQQFVPIDISEAHLQSACEALESEFTDVNIEPIAADFTKKVSIRTNRTLRRLGFFPGSTIGNFNPKEAEVFLANAGLTLGDDAFLLIGVDTKKSPEILHRAYNDKQGVTAKFNRNILTRINKHFDTDITLDGFEHYAFYNPKVGCVEMHLVCLQSQSVKLDQEIIEFTEGETIHTECSYKYTPEEFRVLANNSGWSVSKQWLAPNAMFATYLLKNSDTNDF